MGDKKDKILIADDMETFLRLEKMLLERSGFDIIMAKRERGDQEDSAGKAQADFSGPDDAGHERGRGVSFH